MIYQEAIEHYRQQLLEEKKGSIKIDLKAIAIHPARQSILYELLQPYGFNSTNVKQIWQQYGSQNSRQFYSPNHQAIEDRGFLLVRKSVESNDSNYVEILHDTDQVNLPDATVLQFEWSMPPPAFFSADLAIAIIDEQKLQYPLILRKWQPGDVFQPLGLQGKHQKVQDFLVNQKLSLIEKEQLWILESAEQICWLVGYRLDERFKITRHTTSCVRVSIHQKRTTVR